MSRRLSEQAYHLIKKKIITLELPPSQVIDEQKLMSELELGRTPIREALLQLAKEDLVTIVPRRGMFVADISITDLQKVFEVRVVLEGFCARLAAKRATEKQIAKLEALLDRLEGISGDDVAALMESDNRFHELLYQAADNEFLNKMLNRLYAPSLRLWYLVLERLTDVREAIEQHREIVDAIKIRDGDRAEKLIQQHILEFQREIKAVL
ncbi:MAG TPA: GntR family transcriptional regulator [Chloroflexi bacterium]|nr:GntR family transcriptional regulator [Chloroflexota bacterium]